MKIKAMKEKRNSFYDKAQKIFDAAATEERELTPEEETEFQNLCDQVKKFDAMIDRAREMQRTEESPEIDDLDPEDFTAHAGADDVKNMKQFAADVRDLAKYIRNRAFSKDADGIVDTASSNMTYGDNGVVVKQTIINKIIEKVEELTPLYQLANKYPVGGTITIPVDDESVDGITIALATEFADLTSHSGKLSSVALSPALFGALTKVSKKLINSSDFALINWLIGKFARKLAVWYDDMIINGKVDTTNDNARVVTGILHSYDSTNMKITLGSKDEITADELIDLQELIPDPYQDGAFFIMNRSTRTKIRKLKDGEGNYLLTNDNNARWGRMLLGSNAYTTKAVSALGTNSKDVLIYVNPAGVAVQEPPTKELQVINELFITQHAVGVVLWVEFDARTENTQMVAVASTPAA